VRFVYGCYNNRSVVRFGPVHEEGGGGTTGKITFYLTGEINTISYKSVNPAITSGDNDADHERGRGMRSDV